eukprot:gnl/TRDRNA2_/TRDRNA2_81525_c0_seq1.p1 gnl/TRDRNA2_/TRDRNA2_81525_c0~~gnl/TRDRNA2_/TRDRNA2_81525_c0_seq1.p1  ORF type:complete len:448 (+),score=135.01 gnl/TRDRNA2_/TRDRNA2_81525_c0_seq1:89-1432(+)
MDATAEDRRSSQSFPQKKIHSLLQREAELQGDLDALIKHKSLLERQNEELTARLEVWVGTQTNGVVLERDAFLELERARDELVLAHQQAACAQVAAEEGLAQALEHNGMLRGEVEALMVQLCEAATQRLDSALDLSELQAAIAELMGQLSDLDAEHGALVEERLKKLGQGDDSDSAAAASSAPLDSSAVDHDAPDGTGGEAESDAGEAKASVDPSDAAARDSKENPCSADDSTGPEGSTVASSAAGGQPDPSGEQATVASTSGSRTAKAAERASGVLANVIVGADTAMVLGRLEAECTGLQWELTAEEATLSSAAGCAAEAEETRWKQIDELQRETAELQEELRLASEEDSHWRSECDTANAELQAALALEGAESPGAQTGPAAATDERARWQAEKADLLRKVEEVTRNADISRQAPQALLGQLLLEKEELQMELNALISKTKGAET